ncbi:MAG: hypothetical protein M1840_000424 [Geoglossum simile]|nr:MAG: hypothetical protein M1840_000424 [Geoglossum simile]
MAEISCTGLTFVGTLIDVPSPAQLRVRENHRCVVDQHGIIVQLEEASQSVSGDKSQNVMFPGLIDCHIHAPQYAQLGNKTDLPLMQWLNEYTFPEESRFSDPDYAREVYPRLVRRLVRNGTTTALYFGSSHLEATKILANACGSVGQRAFVGKNCSDGELCPQYYREKTEGGIRDTKAFIEWCQSTFGREGEVRPVITPRFTPTCTRALLEGLGAIAREYDVAVQTHAAETVDQVALVQEMFPQEKRDVAILRNCGLLTPRTVLAHGCHLTDSEVQELVVANVAVISCPYSNVLFSRATLPIPRFQKMGLKIGLGTDIAGGWSSSLWENARLAILQDRVDSFVRIGTHPVTDNKADWEVTFIYALYLATVGGARSLNMDTNEGGIGLFEVGRKFDALDINLNAEDQRFEIYPGDSTRDRFERFVLGGDDRNIQAVWVGGRLVWNCEGRKS